MKAVCIKCGIVTEQIKGSIKYPFCNECFQKTFNGDYAKYHKYMKKRLPLMIGG